MSEGEPLCKTCKRVLHVHGTTEHVTPWYCSCKNKLLQRGKKNEQSVLRTQSTDRTRVRYWMKWLRDQAPD